MTRACAVAAILVATTVAPSSASARVQRDVEYRFDQVWNTLVRLLRVDYRFTIDERDDDHGFLLFHYVEYGRAHTASVELVRVGEESASRVRAIVQVEGVPTHYETQILDDLERKLRNELGRPVRPSSAADGGVSPPSRTMPRLRDEPDAPGDAAESPPEGESPPAPNEPSESAPRRRRR